MNESAQNIAVIGDSAAGRATALQYFYDATASQRYEYVVEENGEEFETAHLYSPKFNSDELYLDWIKSWNISTKSDSEADQKYEESTSAFWDNCIEKVENFETEGDWKSRISAGEKLQGMVNLLAVAVKVNPAKGKLRTGAVSETQTVITEAYWNGIAAENTCQQKHVITNKDREEYRKKYNRIQTKRFKQEKVGGLRRTANVIFIPQNEAIGNLYDEMMIEAEGFVDNKIPLRFKTTVIHHLFESKLDEKK